MREAFARPVGEVIDRLHGSSLVQTAGAALIANEAEDLHIDDMRSSPILIDKQARAYRLSFRGSREYLEQTASVNYQHRAMGRGVHPALR